MWGERADHVIITGFGLSKNLILSIHLNNKRLQGVFYLAQENPAIYL